MDRAIVFLMIGIILILSAVGYGTVQASQEARWNREVLCIGILGNQANTANQDSRLVELCERVGVHALDE